MLLLVIVVLLFIVGLVGIGWVDCAFIVGFVAGLACLGVLVC